jgi:hypothetical protein
MEICSVQWLVSSCWCLNHRSASLCTCTVILLCQVAVWNLDTDQHHSRLCVKTEVLELKWWLWIVSLEWDVCQCYWFGLTGSDNCSGCQLMFYDSVFTNG